MMMGAMGNMMVLWSLLSLLLVLGFSYIIWVLALKENGWVKTAGLVLACAIAVLAVVLALYGSLAGNQIKRGMMGGMMMEGKTGMKIEMPCMKSGMTEKQKMECMMMKMKKLK